jgi:hypothetical protein
MRWGWARRSRRSRCWPTLPARRAAGAPTSSSCRPGAGEAGRAAGGERAPPSGSRGRRGARRSKANASTWKCFRSPLVCVCVCVGRGALLPLPPLSPPLSPPPPPPPPPRRRRRSPLPPSVMLNWEMEFKKWCPAFKLLTYYGRRAARAGAPRPAPSRPPHLQRPPRRDPLGPSLLPCSAPSQPAWGPATRPLSPARLGPCCDARPCRPPPPRACPAPPRSAKERKAKRQGWSKPNAFHVCITSYTLVLQDAKVRALLKWAPTVTARGGALAAGPALCPWRAGGPRAWCSTLVRPRHSAPPPSRTLAAAARSFACSPCTLLRLETNPPPPLPSHPVTSPPLASTPSPPPRPFPPPPCAPRCYAARSGATSSSTRPT